MGPREDQRYAAPPMLSGASYTVPQPIGARKKAVSTTVTEYALTGDLFRQPPDAGGNATAIDFKGDVVVEFVSDGDDTAIVVGPSGGGASGPTFLGYTNVPGFTATTSGTIIYNSKGTGVPPTRWTFTAGALDHRHDSIYVVSRTSAAVLNYRIISGIPGAR